MLERLVNDSQEILKENLSVVLIQIPDTLKVMRLVESELPAGWNEYPYAADTQSLGSDFLVSEEAAVLQVPSSLCPEESIILLLILNILIQVKLNALIALTLFTQIV